MGNGPIVPGEERLLDLPKYLNGKAKVYLAVIGFLWTALVALGGRVWGASVIGAHIETDGHPVMVERVGALEELNTMQFRAISEDLREIKDDLRQHMLTIERE